MSLEQQLADAIASQNTLTQAIAGKRAEIDAGVAAQAAAFAAWKAGIEYRQPYFAINKNASMLLISGAGDQRLPTYMGSSLPDFWGAFSAEIIQVLTGSTPSTRHPEARALLDAMGIGADTLHFHGYFNILKLKVKDPSKINFPGSLYTLFIPYQHAPYATAITYAAWAKVKGSMSCSWHEKSSQNKGSWQKNISRIGPDINHGGAYTHIDIYMSGAAEADEFFIALPQLVMGSYPDSMQLPQLINIYDIASDQLLQNK